MKKLNHVEMKDVMMEVHVGCLLYDEENIKCTVGIRRNGSVIAVPPEVTESQDCRLVTVSVPVTEEMKDVVYSYTSAFVNTFGEKLLQAVNEEIDRMNTELPLIEKEDEKEKFLNHMLLALNTFGLDENEEVDYHIDEETLSAMRSMDLFYKVDGVIHCMSIRIKNRSIEDIAEEIHKKLPKMIKQKYPMVEDVIKTTAGLYITGRSI